MSVASIRFSDPARHDRLRQAAARAGIAISPLAERLIDEGLRMEAHPGVLFRTGPAGRRAALVAGPEVVDVIGAVVGGDVDVADRRTRAAELFAIPVGVVDMALTYYADFTDEIDAELADRDAEAAAEEARWRRRHKLLGS